MALDSHLPNSAMANDVARRGREVGKLAQSPLMRSTSYCTSTDCSRTGPSNPDSSRGESAR
jgi:hypothetical protein